MTSHNENRIWFLYAKALEAKTPEDTNHAVQELRTELDEQSFISKRLVEAQINNLAFLDAPATIIRGQTAAQQTRPGYPKTLTQSKQAL